MKKILLWLESHRAINVGILISYFLLVVLPHKKFGTWINRLFTRDSGLGFTRMEYNRFIAIASVLILLLLAISLYRNLRKNEEWIKIISYFVLSSILAVVIVKILFVINIEMIHFPQYAMFAILIFPMIKRYFGVLIWTTLAGALDEAYQYFYLAPNDTGYYDFNDVVTNLIGATFGLIILKAIGVKERQTSHSLLERSEIKVMIVGFVLITILYLLKIWSVYPVEGVPYPLVKKDLTSFWTTLPPNETFHVMRPLEGIIAVPLLWLIYSKLK